MREDEYFSDESETTVIDDLFSVSSKDIMDSVNEIPTLSDDELYLLDDMSDIDMDEEIDRQMSMSDDDIPDTAIRNGKKKIKRPIGEILQSYLATRSDRDWKDLQTYYWWGIHSFAYKFVGNMDDAYDLTIDTFTKAYQTIGMYNPEKGRFSTWLWAICRNICLSFKHHKARLDIVANDVSDIYDSELFGSSGLSHSLDIIDYRVNSRGEIEQIDTTNADVDLCNISLEEISRFVPEVRKILTLRFVHGKKLDEIAREIGSNVSNVKNKYYRARANLVRIIKVNHAEEYERYLDNMHEKDMMCL